jgi:hypothetical protein
VAQIEELLAGGASEAEVAKKLELKLNTSAPKAHRDPFSGTPSRGRLPPA